jgi:Uma2 family endonuclease
MTLLDAPNLTTPEPAEHIVLEDMSWEFYEHLLEEIGDRNIRVTYDEGRLEIMSPMFKHELYGGWIERLIFSICDARNIALASAGCTTFKIPARKKGLEPDKCYYFQHAQAARRFEGSFDPDIHPAPELAVEIDITSKSVPREPIYAALGVAEIWRFDGRKLQVLHLGKGKYSERKRSVAFPFMPMTEFAEFVLRMTEADEFKVLREFRQWLANLPAL